MLIHSSLTNVIKNINHLTTANNISVYGRTVQDTNPYTCGKTENREEMFTCCWWIVNRVLYRYRHSIHQSVKG